MQIRLGLGLVLVPSRSEIGYIRPSWREICYIHPSWREIGYIHPLLARDALSLLKDPTPFGADTSGGAAAGPPLPLLRRPAGPPSAEGRAPLVELVELRSRSRSERKEKFAGPAGPTEELAWPLEKG